MEKEYYGFLRVGDKKIRLADLASKTWCHDLHNYRLSKKSAPNADLLAPPLEIVLGDPAGLKATIMKALDKIQKKFGVKPYGKSSVLVAELIFTVAADYFGGKGFQNWDQKKVEAWKDAVLKMLAKIFGERVVAIIYHQDESAPHFHVYIMPVVKHKSRKTWNANGRKARYVEGQLKLSSRAFFTRTNLIKWQDEYGLAIKPLGLLRGRRGSEATHRKMRDTQRDLEIARNLTQEQTKSLETATQTANMVIADNEFTRDSLREEKVTLERKREKLKAMEEALMNERAKLDERIRDLELAQNNLESERSRLRSLPVLDVAAKLGFVVSEHGDLRATLPHYSVAGVEFDYRLLLEDNSFRVEAFQHVGAGNWEWKKQGSGKGAIDFMKALMPKRTISEVCNRLAELFPENKAGIVCELMESSNPKLWKGLAAPPRTDAKLVNPSNEQALPQAPDDPPV